MDLRRTTTNDNIYYGPHPCARCKKLICKRAAEQGGVEFDYPDGPIYPNTAWHRHACTTAVQQVPVQAPSNIHENIASLQSMTKALESIKSPVSGVFVRAAMGHLNVAIRRLEKERSTPEPTTALERVVSVLKTAKERGLGLAMMNVKDVASVVDELAATREKLSIAVNVPALRSNSGVLFSPQGLDDLLSHNHDLRSIITKLNAKINEQDNKLAQVPEVGRYVVCPSDGAHITGPAVDVLRQDSRRERETRMKLKEIVNVKR